MKKRNLFLISICVVLILSAFLFGSNGKFSGADDQIQKRITEANKNYKPWFTHIWAPPSGEVETFLFAFQAAIGAGFIGYYIGRKTNVQNNNSTVKDKQTS